MKQIVALCIVVALFGCSRAPESERIRAEIRQIDSGTGSDVLKKAQRTPLLLELAEAYEREGMYQSALDIYEEMRKDVLRDADRLSPAGRATAQDLAAAYAARAERVRAEMKKAAM